MIALRKKHNAPQSTTPSILIKQSCRFNAKKIHRIAILSTTQSHTDSQLNGTAMTETKSMATSYLQTISDIRNGAPVSLFRFVNPTKHSQIRSFSSIYDATSDLQTACNSGVKQLQADFGLFNLESTVTLSSALALEGAGDGTVFTQRSVTNKASFYFKSADSNSFIEDISFRNFVIQCKDGTFFEQQHFIELNGVQRAVFEGLRMYGFRGDAIYLGSGIGPEERHNGNVRISRCVFDGINNANRNAISVIDVDGILIEENSFLRCTRSNMPGPIDFEPNANAWHSVQNVTVRRNRFRANSGGVGEIAFHVPSAVAVPPSNIVIEENDSEGYIGTGSFFYHHTGRLPIESRIDSRIQLLRNVAKNGSRPWFFSDAKGVHMERNSYSDFSQAACLGFRTVLSAVRNISVLGDQYSRIGKIGGVGLAIFNADEISLQDTQFIDCGNGTRSSYAIGFNKGSSSKIEMDGIDISAPTGKTMVAIQKEREHTFTPATNRFERSNTHGLPNFFSTSKPGLN